jgi:hypothetical protein
MEATLVGGGAIEYHASDIYITSDMDLIVQGGSRADLDRVLTDFGFARRGRHWVMDDLFVEVPGTWMSDPVDIVHVDGLTFRVVRREVVLADRIIGFKHWRATAYGAEALAMLAVFGSDLDENALRDRLRAESAEDALDALRDLVNLRGDVNEAALTRVLQQLHPGEHGSEDAGDE